MQSFLPGPLPDPFAQAFFNPRLHKILQLAESPRYQESPSISHWMLEVARRTTGAMIAQARPLGPIVILAMFPSQQILHTNFGGTYTLLDEGLNLYRKQTS